MVGLTVWLIFWIGKHDPGWKLFLSGKEHRLLVAICALTECGFGVMCGMRYLPELWTLIEMDVFAGCLLAACVMDLKERMVYRFVWPAAAVAATGYVCSDRIQGSAAEYMIFVLLQQLLFSRYYGKADCYAFSLCGLIWLAGEDTFQMCVLHMAVSFSMLVIVQMFRKNIAADGNCKEPVPMLPYIMFGYAVCFWIRMVRGVPVVDFQGQRWYI